MSPRSPETQELARAVPGAAGAEGRPAYFAAVGDVHGHMSLMAHMLRAWEKITGNRLRFVLQVGDFEPHRDEADLATMAAPAKYRALGDAPAYFSGALRFDWPVYFIGGNHEPYGFLDTLAGGAEIMANCHYIGRAGQVVVDGLRVAGLSGIYRSEKYAEPRPPVSEIGQRGNKEYISFTREEVETVADLGQADVLLVHEWPEGIIPEEDRAEFDHTRRAMSYDTVGNDCARLLVEVLEPRLVLCGHMHRRYRSAVKLSSGRSAQVCCLASVPQGNDAIAIYAVAPDGECVEQALPGDLTRGFRQRKERDVVARR